MENKKRINALTGARFTAIMIIVCAHFEFLEQYAFGNIYFTYFHNPTMGVDFFFMLSGFGMMLSSINRNPSGEERINGIKDLFTFGKNHVRKIYPLYVTTLLIGIPYYVLVSVIEYGKPFFTAVIYSIIKFAACLTLLQSATGMMSFSHGLNGVCWFLSTLFCIYLISPIVMKFLKRKICNLKLAFVALFIAILVSYTLVKLFDVIDANTIFDDLQYGSPYRRIFYVICGMIIAQIYNINKQNRGSVIFEYLSIGASMIWFFSRNSISIKIGSLAYIVDMVLCASVLYALSLEKGKISKIFASKPMVYLGNISIYIYITHYLIRMYIDFIVSQLRLMSVVTAIIEIIVILCLTFLISVLIDKHNHLQSSK